MRIETDKPTPYEAIQNLYASDHAIVSVDFAKETAEALGCPWSKVPVHNFRTNPNARGGKGIVMEQEGLAIDAARLAEAIADHHGFTYPSMHGIGSRLRVATKAIAEGLKIAVAEV